MLRELGRVEVARPSLSSAARAAVATGVPLLAAHVLRDPDLSWAAIGGFVGALMDRGGSYRARAGNLAAVTGAVGAAGVVGALLGHAAVPAVVGMLLWGSAASFLRVYGVTGANVGLTSSVTLAVSLAMPLELLPALGRGAWLLAGGAWAALLALSVWPLRPLAPARQAVGQCYRALAAYAGEIADLTERGVGDRGLAGWGFDGVRQALEGAWSTLGAGWDGRGGLSSPAEQLLVLVETADQMLGLLVALTDVAERFPDQAPRSGLAGDLRELSGQLSALAAAVEHGEVGAPPAPPLGQGEPPAAAGGRQPPAPAHADELLRALRTFANGAREALQGALRAPGAVPVPGPGWSRGGWLQPVRDNLSGESVLLRHALRVGITAALAVAVSRVSGLEHGHWMTLTVIFILQPYAGLTLVKGLQRVVGTVLGGVVAVLIPLAVHDPVALLVLIALLAAAAVVTLPINYALFAFFVTPTFVLLAELESGSSDLAGARVVNTMMGAVLAVVGSRLLWSMPERRRFPAHAAAALRTARRFLLAVAGAREPSPGGAAALRRELGLEIINAGESLQRLAIEEGGAGSGIEPERTLLVYLRRLAAAAVALPTTPRPLAAEAAAARSFAASAAAALDALADALATGRPPPPLPTPLLPEPCPQPLRPELERIDRSIRVLYGAAARVASSPGKGGSHRG